MHASMCVCFFIVVCCLDRPAFCFIVCHIKISQQIKKDKKKKVDTNCVCNIPASK